jgi:hypothetical protein
LEVSQASSGAIEAIEKAGGTVTCSHFNALAFRALLKPYKFSLLPRRARPPPRLIGYYLDKSKCGYLSPEIQMRNLKLFGAVTSEERYRAQHDAFMQDSRDKAKIQHAEMEAKAREVFSRGKNMQWLGKVPSWNQQQQQQS